MHVTWARLHGSTATPGAGVTGETAGRSARGRIPSLVLAGLLVAGSAVAAEPVAYVSGPAAGDYLGFSVAGVGDLHGDGGQGVAVGLPRRNVAGVNDEGEVWLWFAGKALSDQPDKVLSGEAAGDQFGWAVRPAGDVNADGYPDLVVGAPFCDATGASAGRAYLYLGGPGLSSVPDVVMSGEAAGDQFGYAVAGLGDVNGDGYDDIMVGAPYSAAGGATAGRAYVFLGGASPDSLADATLTGAAGTALGWAVSAAGDFNGDGVADAAIGAILNRFAYVCWGDTLFDATPDLVLQGEKLDDRFGYSIAPAGDFNGDGHDDLVVGAMHNDAGGFDAGRAYLYFGGPGVDATPDLAFTGSGTQTLLGRTVAGAGDVNADGFADVIVGAPTPDTGGALPGAAYVYYGGDPGGPQPPDDQADVALVGEQASSRFGCQVAGVGDRDGDGRADFLVGANLYDAYGRTDAGRAWEYRVPNMAPLAAADTVVTDEDIAALLDPLANDGDLDGALVAASLTVAIQPIHGTATADTVAGTIGYIPAPDWFGEDAFAYLVRDNEGAWSDTTLVTVSVQPVNDRPLAVADTLVTDEDLAALLDPLANDGDLDGALVAASLTVAVPPAHGTATADTVAGTIGYAPEPEWSGEDAFAYLVRDNEGAWSDTTEVTVLVQPVNDRPLAAADADTTGQDTPVSVNVLLNDFDPEGVLAPQSLALVALPAHGVATADTVPGFILYTPAAGYAGADTFAYTVSDTAGAVSDTTLVTVLVRDVSPPSAVSNLAAVAGHGAVTLAWSGVPADADSLEFWRAAWRDGEGQSAWPLFDDAPDDTLPERPASRAEAAAGGVWERVVTLPAAASAWADSVAQRGVWFYEVFARDGAGNWGPPAAEGARARNYRLGDQAEPFDGAVDTLDVARLSASFGLAESDSAFVAACDVGPTDTGDADGLPTTDGEVDFDDLMIVALDFDTAEPPASPGPGGEPLPLAWVRVDERTWSLRLDSPAPRLKGLRIDADLPDSMSATVTPGALLAQQPEPVFLQNACATGLDASLALLGRGLGFIGTGELCRITLSEVWELPDPAIEARDVANDPLLPQLVHTTDVPPVALAAALHQNAPNPFNPATVIRFALPAAARARLEIFAINGRRVATLVDGDLPAGDHAVRWSGRDDRGAEVASGVYLYRLVTGDLQLSRRMTLVK